MSKKTWILITCLVLSLSLGLGGSLAYLTDRDTKVNTFTMGNVDIEVEENFPDSQLKPGVEVTKEAKIRNTGDNDAWVWMEIAVPSELRNYIELYGEWNTELDHDRCCHEIGIEPDEWDAAGNPTSWNVWRNVTGEDGNQYDVITIMYNDALAPGDETHNLLHYVKLSDFVDRHTDGSWWYVENGEETPINFNANDFNIVVSGFALQADGVIDGVEQAYQLYNQQWGDTVVEVPAKTKGQTYDESAVVNEYIVLPAGEEDSDEDCVVATGEDTVVTIVGGTYDTGSNYMPCAVWANGGATVIIKGGRFWCDYKSDFGDGHIDLIYAGSGTQGGGTIIIEGGEFGARGSNDFGRDGAWLLNENDANGKILVKGGRFYNWDPSRNWSEGDVTNFVAEGYAVWQFREENGDWWYNVFPSNYTAEQVEEALGCKAERIEEGTNTLEGETPVIPETNP